MTLTNSVSAGALQFALSRSDMTPYTDAVNAVKSAASSLAPASLTITMSVNGTGCATYITAVTGTTATMNANASGTGVKSGDTILVAPL